jgi:phytoene dehydrogenase-like protein
LTIAQEQVGGRVRTEFIEGFAFDHGAQFVAERGNSLYEYAARNALLLNLPTFKDGDGICFDWQVGLHYFPFISVMN